MEINNNNNIMYNNNNNEFKIIYKQINNINNIK